MSVSKSDLKFYYTSLVGASMQGNSSQSIGGYISDTEYSPYAHITANMLDSSMSVSLDSVLGSGTFIVDNEFLTAHGNGNSLNISQRGLLNTMINPHAANEPIFLLPGQSLFNNAFSPTYQQFRCLAVKNTNLTNTFFDLSFYIKQPPLTSNTILKIALEVPRTNYVASVADGGTTISIVDTELTGGDNFYTGCVIQMNSGLNINQRKTILSFDQDTFTLVLDSILPFAVSPGDNYEIQPSPSQILSTGTSIPTFNTNQVSQFTTAASSAVSLSINFSGIRTNGADLHPHEIMYLWIERDRVPNSPAYLSDRIMFTARYRIM